MQVGDLVVATALNVIGTPGVVVREGKHSVLVQFSECYTPTWMSIEYLEILKVVK